MGSDATLNTTTGALALATVNSNVGTFQGLTVNGKGLVTAAANQNYLTANQSISLTGDLSGTGATSIFAQVVALRGKTLSTTAPTNGQVLTWLTASNEWIPQTPGAGGGSFLPLAGGVLTGNLGLLNSTATYPLNLSSTYAGSSVRAVNFSPTVQSTETNSQDCVGIEPVFAPTGASLNSVAALRVAINLSGAIDVTNTVAGLEARVSVSSYTGAAPSSLRNIAIFAPTGFSANTKRAQTYSALYIQATSNGNGWTSQATDNYGIYVNGAIASPGAGGTVVSRGIEIALPSGGGAGINTNYGLRLTGDGGSGAGTITNYALHSDSTALSQLLSLRIGTGTANAPTATSPYLYTTASAGIPTGVPRDAAVGAIAIQWDSTNKKLMAYDQPSATWRDVATATIPLPIASGGTNAITAAAALTSLGAAPLASPTFTGTPSLPTGTTAVTQATTVNNTTLATTAYVRTGTTTNDNAAAGVVGEYATASATAVSLTSPNTANVTSISLTAGDWDVEGAVKFNFAATTTSTIRAGGITATTATMPTTLADATAWVRDTGAITTGAAPIVMNTGMARISLAAPATIFLVANATFATSTCTADGIIKARRRR